MKLRRLIAKLAGLLAHREGIDRAATVLDNISAALRAQARSAMQ